MNSNLVNKEDFSKFGKSFQENLCQLILQDRLFADQIGEVLEPSLFELKYLQAFCSKIYEYKEKYGLHPTYNIFTSVVRTEFKEEGELTQKQIREYFARIISNNYLVESPEYIKEVSLDFCKKQKLKEAIISSIKLLNSSSFEDIKNLIDDALKLGNDNNFGYDYLKDFELRFIPTHRNPVATGWPDMNKITSGGLGSGELGVVIAPTGAGKSMALVHLGTHALKHGQTVIHYTLELQDTVIARRYDSCLSTVKLDDLMDSKAEILEKVKAVDGKLIIKEYPTKSASTNTIIRHLEKMQMRGEKIGMIIVDYGDLLRPTQRRKEKRNELESIYEELRAIGQKFECPIWTASQTNRSGLNAEVITMESISEAFSKCFIADLIFSISRTVQDKNTNTGRIYIAKNRNGPDGMVYPIFMDTSNVSIKILPRVDGEEYKIEQSSKEIADDLKSKYKKFRKRGKT